MECGGDLEHDWEIAKAVDTGVFDPRALLREAGMLVVNACLVSQPLLARRVGRRTQSECERATWHDLIPFASSTAMHSHTLSWRPFSWRLSFHSQSPPHTCTHSIHSGSALPNWQNVGWCAEGKKVREVKEPYTRRTGLSTLLMTPLVCYYALITSRARARTAPNLTQFYLMIGGVRNSLRGR